MTAEPDASPDNEGFRGVRVWFVRLLFAGASTALIVAGVVHLADGLALEGAFPASIYIRMNHPLTADVYASAASALQRCASRDGDALILAGEALARSGDRSRAVEALLRRGLASEPATARGWTLLTEEKQTSDRRSAADALSMSLSVAPRDYWVLGRNMVAAGNLWDVLPDDARQTAVGAVANLWRIEDRRVFIRPLLATPAGGEMMTTAMRFDPEEMRALNRWLAAQTLDAKQAHPTAAPASRSISR